ncbi:MAG: outer membrane lipoprotein-sorting protein [Leptospiraceae bacterium]|nr:outer membrane lipoprotein-sorting protein [Leptospiraceae bacterium]
MKILLLAILLLQTSILPEEKLGSQEIVEKLDRTLVINEGLTLARLYIKKGNHETHSWNVNIFKQGDDVLYTFEITHHKPVAKFLSIKRGEKLIYYNVLSGNFFQIEQMEKMQSILGTSFSFRDLSHYLYEANYNPEKVDRTKSENSDPILIKMNPISFPSYKHLELYADNSDYSPLKIDFTSPNGLLIKTLKFKYGQMKIREGKSISNSPSLKKLEMNDNATNYTSILEFLEWNKNVKPEKIFYEMKTMYEKF